MSGSGPNRSLLDIVNIVYDETTNSLKVALSSGTIALTISTIEIGAVEMKDAYTEKRVAIAEDGDLASYKAGMVTLLLDRATNTFRAVPGDTEVVFTATPNRSNWGVRTVAALTASVEHVGPNVAVPNGFGVICKAHPDNTASVYVGAVGETGDLTKSIQLDGGEVFPASLCVSNLNQLAFQCLAADNQSLIMIVER